MQALVKSSMVMDIDEHNAILDGSSSTRWPSRRRRACGLVRLHLSGHFCHAPKPEMLDVIEECGAVVVDDDLYTGFRHISTDVPEDGDPVDALAQWYLARNVGGPVPHARAEQRRLGRLPAPVAAGRAAPPA